MDRSWRISVGVVVGLMLVGILTLSVLTYLRSSGARGPAGTAGEAGAVGENGIDGGSADRHSLQVSTLSDAVTYDMSIFEPHHVPDVVQVNTASIADSTTIILPPCSGRTYNITVTDNEGSSGQYPIVVQASGNETIIGESQVTLSSRYSALLLYCDGSSWHLR